MSALPTGTMTAQDLLANASRFGRCELIRGRLVRMSPAGGRHGFIADNLAGLIREHVRRHRLGRTAAAETGFRLERNPDSVRAPDVAFIAAHRAAEADTPKFIPIPPDFCAEVLSPEDRAMEVSEKVRWWLDHGVRLVWVVDPANETVTSYGSEGEVRIFNRGETITAGDVIPDLSIAVDDIFEF